MKTIKGRLFRQSLKLGISIILFLLISVSLLKAQNFSNGFNFYLPAFDSSSSPFLPEFPNPEPISGSFLSTDNSGNFLLDNKPIRFWGTNLIYEGAFPNKEDASAVTARMRKMGFNLVRFHHIDNNFNKGSLFYQTPNTRQLNEVNRDKLEYLIYHLKEQGIYVNMNLNVSRVFTVADGVLDADTVPEFAKGVTIFDPYLIELQKEYATDLLTHVNPYTGLALVDDPVMAMVEIVNENSLLRLWRQDELNHVSEGGKLNYRHNRMLDSLWHDYLKKKYLTSDSLKTVWSQGSDTVENVLLLNHSFTESATLPEGWATEMHEGASGSVSIDTVGVTDTSSLKIIADNIGTELWHFCVKHVGLTVRPDTSYNVSFYMKADSTTSMYFNFMKEVDPWTWYAGVIDTIGTEWRKFTIPVSVPEDLEGITRLAFGFYDTGTFWIDDIKVEKLGTKGIDPEENLEDISVKRIKFSETKRYTNQRVQDMTSFYVSLHQKFSSEMKNFLVNELGVKIPVTGANWLVGPEDLLHQENFDYIDNHGYWDSPQFPGIPWSPTDWYIMNKPQLKEANAPFTDMFSGFQFKDKPFTISETNYTYPNQYQAELLPLITAYSSFQGVDGIMLFDYNEYTDWDTDIVHNFFSIHRNNVIMAGSPLFAHIYRNGLIAESTSEIEIELNENDIYLLPKKTTNIWESSFPFPKKLSLTNKYIISDLHADSSTPSESLPSAPEGEASSDTDEIYWNNRGLLEISTSNVIGLTGQLNSFIGKTTGNLTLNSADGFGSLTWLSIEENALTDSRKSLFLVVTTQTNSGMVWNGTSTVNGQWGSAPTLIKPLKLNLSVEMNADSLRIFPLTPTGSPDTTASFLVLPTEQRKFTFELDQNDKHSLWFGVQAYGDGAAPLGISDDNNSSIFKVFPNPSKKVINVSSSLTDPYTSRLLNAEGIKVRESKFHGAGQIEVSDLAKGVYFLMIENEHSVSVEKIIIN